MQECRERSGNGWVQSRSFLIFGSCYSCLPVGIFFQWSFQEPKLEVPSMYKAYVRAMYVRECPHKVWCYNI